MRPGFEAIASDWFQDDMFDLSKRLQNAYTWVAANGGLVWADFDEQMTLDMMAKRQTVRAARAGAFEPFLGAQLGDEAIARALFDDDQT